MSTPSKYIKGYCLVGIGSKILQLFLVILKELKDDIESNYKFKF